MFSDSQRSNDTLTLLFTFTQSRRENRLD